MFMVVNAARKHHDLALMQKALPDGVSVALRNDVSLLALQGPRAAQVLGGHTDVTDRLAFMETLPATIGSIPASVSRSGYTGEDGFEISVVNEDAPALFDLLRANPLVKPAGLGARDSLRLEAGCACTGRTSTPSIGFANLLFATGKRRRAGRFVGAEAVMAVWRKGLPSGAWACVSRPPAGARRGRTGR